jgi:hypothetical protein
MGCSELLVLFPPTDAAPEVDSAVHEGHRDAVVADASADSPSPADVQCVTLPCDQEPCRLVSPQCGCPCGLACVLTSEGRKCTTPGTNGLGEACSENSDCEPGLACLGSNGGNACTPYCDTDAQCTASVCWAGSVPGTGACPHACNLATQTGCPAGQDCFSLRGPSIDDGTIVRSALCGIKPASGSPGTDCTNESNTNWICGPGLLCVNNRCEEYCDLAAPSCPSGQSCTRFSPTLQVGDIEYGACL